MSVKDLNAHKSNIDKIFKAEVGELRMKCLQGTRMQGMHSSTVTEEQRNVAMSFTLLEKSSKGSD